MSSPASISVVIPTQRRPEGLKVAAGSVFRQLGVDFAHLEMVIVDNDQIASAQPVVRQLAAEAPFPVRYVHEPRAGVSNARNAALTAAAGAWIAFLDDDEEASEGWLAALVAAQARLGADVVFGPVQARTPQSLGDHQAYLTRFFSREGPAATRIIDGYYGCGDSLIRRAALPDPRQPFDVRRNRTGGEDDRLFGAMKQAGARFAWAAGAIVFEDPAPERLTLGYAFARAFAYGMGPACSCAVAEPPDVAGVAYWMAVGAGQTAVFGLIAAIKWLVRAPDRAQAADRMFRGLGKVFWFGPFRRSFYGRSAPPAPSQVGAAPAAA